jgi:hypothetical protein
MDLLNFGLHLLSDTSLDQYHQKAFLAAIILFSVREFSQTFSIYFFQKQKRELKNTLGVFKKSLFTFFYFL